MLKSTEKLTKFIAAQFYRVRKLRKYIFKNWKKKRHTIKGKKTKKEKHPRIFSLIFLIIIQTMNFAISKDTVALCLLRQLLLSSRIKRVFIHFLFLFFEAQKPLMLFSCVKKKRKKTVQQLVRIPTEGR